MNILIHYYRLGHYIGGAEVIALNQCAEFINQGHNITILTADVGRRSKIFDEFIANHPSVKLVELPLIVPAKTGDTWTDIDIESYLFGKYAAEHFYAGNTEPFDIVVIHNKTDALFIPNHYKTVIHLHGSPEQFDNLMEIALYNANGLLAVSESVKDAWTANIKSLRRPISVIHNGVDSSIFKNTNQRRDIDVLFVGRLYPHKGILELLEAATTHNFYLVVVGAGPLEAEIAKYSHVQHYKNVSTEELIRFYNRAKVFACPSSANEGVLTTMLEAAMCGCAIITTNCAGMVDFARHEYNSLLVPPKDVKALSNAITELLTDDTKRSQIAKCAEYEAVNNWNIQRQTNKLLDFYKSIICE